MVLTEALPFRRLTADLLLPQLCDAQYNPRCRPERVPLLLSFIAAAILARFGKQFLLVTCRTLLFDEVKIADKEWVTMACGLVNVKSGLIQRRCRLGQ